MCFFRHATSASTKVLDGSSVQVKWNATCGPLWAERKTEEGTQGLITEPPPRTPMIFFLRLWFGTSVVVSVATSQLWSIEASVDVINSKCRLSHDNLRVVVEASTDACEAKPGGTHHMTTENSSIAGRAEAAT